MFTWLLCDDRQGHKRMCVGVKLDAMIVTLIIGTLIHSILITAIDNLTICLWEKVQNSALNSMEL